MDELVYMLWDDEDSDVLEQIENIINAVEGDTSSSSESSSGSESESDSVSQDLVNFASVIEKYNPVQFKAHLRIMPSTAEYLIDCFSASTYNPDNCNGGRRSVGGKKSVFMYLWYISNTITFRQLAALFNVSKSTAWVTVKRVTLWLVSIGHEHIKWPQGADIHTNLRRFQEKNGIPGIIGAIDCTHIRIKAPSNDKECYFDRKQNYSLVLQAVVDANKKFINISCGEPGSYHDFRVLRRSELYQRAESNEEELFPNNTFILGDSAYPPNRWIVPPFKDYGNLTEPQKKFNKMHSSTRITVENAFALLKTRFRRFLKFTEQTSLPTLTNLIVSGCILHNICISMDDLHESPEEFENQNEEENIFNNLEFTQASNRRDILFNYLIEQNII